MSNARDARFAARPIPLGLRARFEVALKADFDRLIWMEESLLSESDGESAVRQALLSAYRALARFHHE